MKPSTQILIAAITMACLSVTKGAVSTTLFSDNFNDLAVSNMRLSTAELNADSWYFVGRVGGAPWTTGEDSVSPLSGTVLENPGGSSSWVYAVRQFPATTLSKTGDSLTVKLDYHVERSTDSGSLDVALLNTSGSIENNSFTEEEGSPLLNATGYSAYQYCVATPFKNLFVKIKNAAEAFDASKTTVANSASPSVLGDAAEAHTLIFSLTKGDSGIEMTWSVDGTVVGSCSDMDSSYNVFNTLRLLAPSDAPLAHLDNISVVANIAK